MFCWNVGYLVCVCCVGFGFIVGMENGGIIVVLVLLSFIECCLNCVGVIKVFNLVCFLF